MDNKDKNPLKPLKKDPGQRPGSKKPYVKPKLVAFGHITDVTLGPSPGLGESGNPDTLKGAGSGLPD